MAEQFKENLEKYWMSLIIKIPDKSQIQQIQNDYETLIDDFWKYDFLSKDEIDAIIESELDEQTKQFSELKVKYEQAVKDKNDAVYQAKILTEHNQGWNQKLEILQRNLEQTTKAQLEKEKAESALLNSKSDLDLLLSKYNSWKNEMEIYKKNIKKNFNMEKEIKQWTEENEKLSYRIRLIGSNEDFKTKYDKLEQELLQVKSSNEKMVSEIATLQSNKDDILRKYETCHKQMSILENENKLKAHQLDESLKDNEKTKREINDLRCKLKENEDNAKMSKMVWDNKNKEFKKELDKLYKTNNDLKTKNDEITIQWKNIQNYTNFAKCSKENLSKKDFSMLETMSRRVEETECFNKNLKEVVGNLTNDNKELKEKVEKYIDLLCYYMKALGEVKDIFKDNIFETISDEDRKAVYAFKGNNSKLLETIFSLKNENNKLLENIQQITIECNQRWRSASYNNGNDHAGKNKDMIFNGMLEIVEK